MSKNLCDICKTYLGTEDGLIQHKKKGFYKAHFDGLILKNRKKYFIFSKNKQITKKHDEVYNMSYIYSHSVEGDVKGYALKESKTTMPTGVINKNLKAGNLQSLTFEELKQITYFLDKQNKEMIYFSKKIKRYFTLLE